MTWRDALDVEGPLSDLECEVLAELAAATTARRALEVGHWKGRSTVVLLESLPAECALTTIDWHQGDYWCPATDAEAVKATMVPHVGDRRFVFIDEDMLTASLSGTFGFVFYDSNHTEEAVSAWWVKYRELLAPDCTLVWDDADWEEQSILLGLAVADGFRSVRTREFWRCPVDDKHTAETYTLEVMRRDA